MTWAIDQLAAIQNRNGVSDVDCQAADDGMTEQAHLKDADINNIVRRFLATGALDQWNIRTAQPIYGDFTQAQDFQTNLNTVIAAEEAFDSLPADIRKRFHNSIPELMTFLADPKNLSEAQSLGLVKPTPKAASAVAPAAPAASTPSS